MSIPVLGDAPDVMKGTMTIRGPGGRWTERYFLGQPDPAMPIVPSFADGLIMFSNLIARRAYLLAGGYSIISGVLTLKSKPRKSVQSMFTPFDAAPVTGELLATVEACNEVGDGFLFRFEDSNGKYDERLFRAMRDSWIQNQALNPAKAFAMPDNTVAYSGVAWPGVKTIQQAWNDFLGAIMQTTVLVKGGFAGPNPYKYFANGITVFRGVGNRKTGQSAGRSRARAMARV